MTSVEAWEKVVKQLAITHAKYWGAKDLPEEAMLKSADWMSGKSKETWEATIATGKRAWEHVDKTGFSDRVINFMDKVYASANFDEST